MFRKVLVSDKALEGAQAHGELHELILNMNFYNTKNVDGV